VGLFPLLGFALLLPTLAPASVRSPGNELSDTGKIIVEALDTQLDNIPPDVVPRLGRICLSVSLTDVRGGEVDALSGAIDDQKGEQLEVLKEALSRAQATELTGNVAEADRGPLHQMGLFVVGEGDNDKIFSDPTCTSIVRSAAPVIVEDLAISVSRFTPVGMSGAYTLPVVLKRYGSRWHVIAQGEGQLLLVHPER
jgi:hypothetical protein